MSRPRLLRGFAAMVAVLAALVVWFAPGSARAVGRDAAQEADIDRQLSAVDPSLVALAHRANDAVDRGDDAAAARGYAEVHARAPNVVAVTRRLGVAEVRTGDVAHGIAHCREALAAEGSAQNHAALASALAAAHPLGPQQAVEAEKEARNAVSLAPDAEYAQTAACQVAAAAGDADMLASCAAALRRIAPNGPATHLFTALGMAHDGRVDAALREIDAAHAAGLSDVAYRVTRDEIAAARPKPHPVRAAVGATLAVWVGLLFLLVVGGMLLSDATSRARAPSALVRGVSRATLAVAVAMFWVSAAIASAILALVLALVVTTFVEIAALSRLSLGALALFAAYVAIAAARALLARLPKHDLGEPVDLAAEKDLRAALDEASTAVGGRKIAAAYARPDATVEVVEIGGPLGHLLGRNRLAIVVGVGALEGLTRRQLVAMAAAGIARYRARGGAGGDLAIVERARVAAIVERMELRGVSSGANPAWWFVRLYQLFFESISQAAVKLQLALADRDAAQAFGSRPLADGLEHVARRHVEVGARARGSIRDVIDADALDALGNLYARAIDGDVRGEVDTALEAIEERVDAIEALDADGSVEEDDSDAGPAWALWSDRAELEQAMTERLRRELRERAGFGGASGDQPSSASSVARA